MVACAQEHYTLVGMCPCVCRIAFGCLTSCPCDSLEHRCYDVSGVCPCVASGAADDGVLM
jgi:hypothetical protein